MFIDGQNVKSISIQFHRNLFKFLIINRTIHFIAGLTTKKTTTKTATRESSCVNARGTLPAAWQVLAMLLCLLIGGGVPHSVLPGGWEYSIKSLTGGVPHPRSRWRVPHPRSEQEGTLTPSRPRMGYPTLAGWDTPHHQW